MNWLHPTTWISVLLVMGVAVVSCESEAPMTEQKEVAAPAPLQAVADQSVPGHLETREWLQRVQAAHVALEQSVERTDPKREERGALKKTAELADSEGEELAHSPVDAAFRQGRAQASSELARAFEAARPSALPELEWRKVRQGIAAALASAAVREDRAKDAVMWADRGLSVDDSPTLFRANLFITRAQAEKSLGQVETASATLFEALKINEVLLDKELEDP